MADSSGDFNHNTEKKSTFLMHENSVEFAYQNDKKPMLLTIVKQIDSIGATHIENFEIHCEVGMGHTIGHALRRVLLSNFFGIAPVAVRIKTVTGKVETYARHQFDILPGVAEPVIEIISNIRKLYVSEKAKLEVQDDVQAMFLEDEKIEGLMLCINAFEAGSLTIAKAHVNSETIEVVNKNLHLCTLDTKVKIEIEIYFGWGYGSISAADHKFKPQLPEGYIRLDSDFSPILSFDYKVEEVTGEKIEYDKLDIKIETNHSIIPFEALQQAAAKIKNNIAVIAGNIDIDMMQKEDTQTDKLYETKIEQMNFTARTINSLKSHGINTLGELLPKTPPELLAMTGFGDGCLDNVIKELYILGLQLSTKGNRRKV